jgi:hypothetical protein
MKKIKEEEIIITVATYEVQKRPRSQNQSKNTISFTIDEIKNLGSFDSLKVSVHDTSNKLLHKDTYSRNDIISGSTIKHTPKGSFYIFRYK